MGSRAFYYICCVLLLFFSCTSNNSRIAAELNGIDSLTESNADSARMQLEALKAEIADAEDDVQTYYNLLCVKAADKAKVKHVDDSLICSVADYYEKLGDPNSHLAEAYYYVGRANVDMRRSDKAIFFFHKALQCDSINLSDRMKSRIYAQIGYIYLRNNLFDEAKNMQEVAYFYCKNIGDTLGMRYCKEDIKTITMLADSIGVDKTKKAAMMLQIQRATEKVKNDNLVKQNAALKEKNDSEKNTFYFIAMALVLILAGIASYVFMQKKRGREEVPAIEPKQEPAPIVHRQFYDKEISELITTHINTSKPLKPSDWKLIEERLSSSFPNFKEQLYSVYNLSETEYRVCELIKIEVSPSNIAKLLSTTASSISQIRVRLQHKVFNGQGSAKDWDIYILSL